SIVLGINLPSHVIPALAAALTAHAIASEPSQTLTFYVSAAAAAIVAIVLNFAIFVVLVRPRLASEKFGLHTFFEDLPSTTLNILLVLAGAAITEKLGNAGIAFALSAVFTYSYMARLLQRARRR